MCRNEKHDSTKSRADENSFDNIEKMTEPREARGSPAATPRERRGMSADKRGDAAEARGRAAAAAREAAGARSTRGTSAF